MMSTVANVLIGSLAWYFYSTKKTITTPMTFNAPFSCNGVVLIKDQLSGLAFKLCTEISFFH